MNGVAPTTVVRRVASVTATASLSKDVKAPETEAHETVYGPVEDECFGKRIRKSFGSRAFWGTIVTSYVVGKGVFYKVSFDDGDIDILSAGEVYHDLQAAKRHADEDTLAKEPESERSLAIDSPTSLAYVDALRTKKSSLKRRRDSSDSPETHDEVSTGNAWDVKLWSLRLFATIMEEDGFIRVQDFVPMPNGERGEMESTGKVQQGDAMLAVQGRIVHGVMDHMQACDLIRTLPRPLTLTFIRPPKKADAASAAAVEAAIDHIRATRSQMQGAPSTEESASKKPRVDPPSSAPSTSGSIHPHHTATPPTTSAPEIPPRPSRQPSPEVQIVGVSRPASSTASSQIHNYAPAPMQRLQPGFSGPTSSLQVNGLTFVPTRAGGHVAYQSHASGLGGYHQPPQNRSRTPSPGPPNTGYTGTSGPRQLSGGTAHQPSHQEVMQMPGSDPGQLATLRIPAHLISSTSAPYPSSSHQVVSQSGTTFSGPPAYQRPDQAPLNGSRSGVHSNQNVVHLGTQSFGRYAHPSMTSSAPATNQSMNHQQVSTNVAIQGSSTAALAGRSHAPPPHGNASQAVRYTYSRERHGSMPPSGTSLGHRSPVRNPRSHSVSTNTFQRMAGRQDSSEDARNMTLGDYMLYTAQQERLALRNGAVNQRTQQALHSTPAQPQPQSLQSTPVSTTAQHRVEPRTVQAPIVGAAAVRRERSPPSEDTQDTSFENFDDVLAQVATGAGGSTGSSFLSLSETSFLAEIPIKQRASRISKFSGARKDTLLPAAGTSPASPRPQYLSKFDADGIVEVTISRPRLYLTLAPMGQYISISSFVRGGNGEVGEIEASGKVLAGDVLVGIGPAEIPAFMSPGEVARIVNTQPRPYTAYFIRATWEMLE